MSSYRIQPGQGYNGCEPITVYWVQVHKNGIFGSKWVNVKGFEDRQKAEDLLHILQP